MTVDATRVCRTCGQTKPLSEFRHRRYKNKRWILLDCRNCEDVQRRQRYQLSPEPERQRQLAYYHTHRSEHTARRIQWFKDHPENAESLKMQARQAANKAVQRGVLQSPGVCEDCGQRAEPLHKHHESYAPDRWLDVTWLCSHCHGKRHRRY